MSRRTEPVLAHHPHTTTPAPRHPVYTDRDQLETRIEVGLRRALAQLTRDVQADPDPQLGTVVGYWTAALDEHLRQVYPADQWPPARDRLAASDLPYSLLQALR